LGAFVTRTFLVVTKTAEDETIRALAEESRSFAGKIRFSKFGARHVCVGASFAKELLFGSRRYLMKVQEIMTPNPTCCTPDTPLLEVAQMFIDHDCGAIPVVESASSRRPVGIITDRDIACRAIAAGKNALALSARDCMSAPCLAVAMETSLAECCEIMERNQVRRVLVIDEAGRCCGIIAQADIALRERERNAAKVLREISRPRSKQAGARHERVSKPGN
jgi:CBS domain-containing protein